MQHHILVKWKERPADVPALCQEIQAVFAPAMEIPGVENVELIPNIIDRPNRYDLLIRITMQESALPLYDASEAHHRWKEQYSDRIAQKAIFDCQ